MKAGWSLGSIGDVCDVVNGGTPKTGVPEYWGGQHQWITPAEMGKRNSPYVSRTERAITDQGLQNSSARPLPPMSVILSSRAPIGHLVINTEPMATNQGCKGLVPRKQIDHKFLYYYLGSIVELLNDLGTGATFKELSGGKLKEVPVPLPPLPEQQRIVTLLDEAFDGIATAKAHAEKNLQNARAIFESQRDVLLSFKQDWLEAPLAALCEVKHGYAFEGEFFASDGDYVLLTPGSFFETGGYRERGEKTKFFRGQIPGDYILDVGDLLVAMTEQAAGLLGSPLLVPESDRFLHNQRLGLVTGKPGIPWDNEFFFHVFNLGRVRQEVHASSSGVKVRHTSPGRIGAVQVAYPKSVAEQTSVAAQLGDLSTECERLESLYRQKLTALDDLKKSLLHRAFNGDL
jgi:type I restriction enzyme S subunit